MEECSCNEKSKTPYFIPKTAPATVQGVERLRNEFYGVVRRAHPKSRDPRQVIQAAIDVLNRVEVGAAVSAQACSAAREGLNDLLASSKSKTRGVRR